jgi:hypothetical protein
MENQEGLLQKIAREGAEQTVQALAMAQKMGMVTDESSLTEMIKTAMETVLEEYVNQIENASKIILDETGSIRTNN